MSKALPRDLRLVQPRVVLRDRGRGGRHDGEIERRARAGAAFDPHPSAHEFAQALAYGKAEARSAVVSRRRRIDLAERFKEPVETVRGNPDARIPHGEPQFVVVAPQGTGA